MYSQMGGYISMYRSIEQTMKSIEKYSEKDVHTWKKMFERNLEARGFIVGTKPIPEPYLQIHCCHSVKLLVHDKFTYSLDDYFLRSKFLKMQE
jgi:hypothetical protein